VIINGSTAVYGIIGYPVAHSFSPAVQNAALEALGLNGVYLPFSPRPENLQQALEGLRALGIVGANVTVPYKEAVIEYLDQVDTSASVYGAVNTIVNRQGELIGYNTDGAGFIRDLSEQYALVPKEYSALIIGAGGAARAVTTALAQAGCQSLALVNRHGERAIVLAQELSTKTGLTIQTLPWEAQDPQLVSFARQANLVINCTSAGMAVSAKDGESGAQSNIDWPLPKGLPAFGQLAYDLVYNPPVTPFMTRALANGAKATNGLGMLLHQGALALELWTGLSAPLEVMRKALYRR